MTDGRSAKRSFSTAKMSQNPASQSLLIHRKLTGSPSQEALFSDLCLKISPNVTNTSLNNNVLSPRLAGEYWREVCGASRRSGPAFAGGSAVAGRGPCLLLLGSRLPATCLSGEPRTPPTIRSSTEQMFYTFPSYLLYFKFIPT